MAEEAGSGKANILVLEDNEGVRTLTVTILEAAGYGVIGAASPERLLEEEPGTEIDLVLSDVVMPGMSGPEFSLQWLRRHPGTRFLFMSGFFDDTTAESVLTADNLIRKPFKATELVERVRKILEDG